MFRKIILIISLVMLTGIGALMINQRQSNDENSVSAYGRFTDDHYISEYLGIDIDMSDRWVYFTEKTLSGRTSETAMEYGVDLDVITNSFSEYGFFLAMLKPGTVAVFADTGNMFTEKDFSLEAINALADITCAMYNEKAGGARLLNSGLLSTDNPAGYFTLRLGTDGISPQMDFVFSFFNTDKTGIISMCVTYEGTTTDTFMELLEDKVTILHIDDTAGV